MSSLLQVALAAAGIFTIGLGIWHLGVPRWFAFREALAAAPAASTGPALEASSGPALAASTGPADPATPGTFRIGPWRYARRQADVLGLSWVMSNAASYVLVSIGVVDVAWALGDRTVPLQLGSAWIAGWWLVRAIGQRAVGVRRGDVAIAIGFSALGIGHVVVALVGLGDA